MKHEKVTLQGHTEIVLIKRDGSIITVLDEINSIGSGVAEYLAESMNPTTTVPDYAIDDLFTNDGILTGGSQDGKDGISVYDSTDTLSTITTSETPSNTYAKKWKGEITFGSSLTVYSAWLGQGYNGSSASNIFDYVFASQIGINEAVQASDTMVINWELYF